MGCCVSAPAPYDGGQHGNASSRNPIISDQPRSNTALVRPSTNQSNRPQQSQATSQQRKQVAPELKVNRTLKRLVWTSEGKIWTRREIDQEREDFFFTRVTGREEVWQTIRSALEVMWAGGDSADQDGGIATASEILKAASITLPHSTLDRGAYDVTGVFYPLPNYIVCDPTNMVVENRGVEDDESKDEERDKSEALSEDDDEEELQRRREEKGKAVADPENVDIRLKARRSDSGDLVIIAGKKDTVRQLTRKFNQSGGLTPPKHIQLYYLGKILNEEKTLQEEGWTDGHMLQAFVK